MYITISIKKVVAVLLAVILLAVVLTAWACGLFSRTAGVAAKLREVDSLVQSHYLYLDDVDWAVVEDSAATGMVSALEDRYTTYFTADAYQNKQQIDDGSVVGIGVGVMAQPDSSLLVMEIYEGSPALAEGLQVGDAIVAVDGVELSDISYAEAIGAIQGEEGSTVEVEVLRKEERLTFHLTRAEVALPAVTWTMIDSVAYVKILSFTHETAPQFETAMTQLQQDGATGVVFDLRGNGGGLLDASIDILDQLLPEGALVTMVESDGKETVRGESDADCIEMPMACLTNELTASAAELFVQALKDYDWAVSVGTTTYGKGVMQTTYSLSDGTAVKLTTAYYNPPSGENYNGVGVVPDVEVQIEDESGFVAGDVEQDPQLAAAISWLQEQG